MGGARSAHWAYWWKRDECWSEIPPVQRRERERRKRALLLSLCPLPTHFSVVSQDWSFIYSLPGPMIHHLASVENFSRIWPLNSSPIEMFLTYKASFASFKAFGWIIKHSLTQICSYYKRKKTKETEPGKGERVQPRVHF